MTWDVICHILQPYGLSGIRKATFEQGENLLLYHRGAADLPHTVYVSMGGAVTESFHYALIVSIGPCSAAVDNGIELAGGELAEVFNALAGAKNRLDGLNRALALCTSDQEIVDRASIHLGLPMFYLDQSYRVLAITKSLPAPGNDPEWVHMTEKGYLSPQNAQRMKASGDLDLLAPSRKPMVYLSDIYPFPSIVCNVWLDGAFVSRLNLLCVDGDTSPLMVRICELITDHLSRLADRRGMLAEGPLQSMLIDLLHGVRLSDDLIRDRLKSAPRLADSLIQLFYVDVEARDDRQIAPYYASLLTRLMPEENILPLVFQEQLILLIYGGTEVDFDSITVKLAHFVATHHLRCGVSNPFHTMGDLKGHCEQAQAALQAEPGEGLHFYRTIMLDRLLGYIPPEQTRFLISPDIFRLEQANRNFSFSLVDTLKVYLECNCNLIRTAERLFLHKNTLLYRLNHIKSIIRCDLNDADQRLLLMLSFKLLERK